MRASTAPSSDGRIRRGPSRLVLARADDRFVFGPRLRTLVVVYAMAVALLTLLVAPGAADARSYLQAMAIVSCVAWAPGVLVAGRAARRAAPGDRPLWWIWVGSFVAGCAFSARMAPMGDEVWVEVQDRAVPAAVLGVLSLVVSSTLMLRSRSGRRAVLVDVADIGLAVVAVVVPLVLVVGDPVAQGPHPWFTASAAIWFVGALYGTTVVAVLALRVRPEDRTAAHTAVQFGVVALVAAAAQVVIGTADFAWAPGPFLATYALSCGFFVVFLAHSTRRASRGLERLPARAQVRRRPLALLLVLGSVAITGALVWLRHEEEWPLVVALVAAALVVALFCLRELAAVRETRLLYRDVERTADERGALLTDVLARSDAERHRVATHLHRQSVELYAALATATSPIGGGTDPAAARVTERLRVDLGRQSDELGRFAAAVRPPCEEPMAAPTLPTLARVVLEGRYPEGRTPHLVATVDPDLRLAWTDEAVLARITEHALRLLAAEAPAATTARLDLGLAGDGSAIVLDLTLDRGDRDEPAGHDGGDDLTPIHAGAELLGATVERLDDDAAVGLRVRVPLAVPGAGSGSTAGGRPELRAVD